MRDLPTFEDVSAALMHKDGVLYWKSSRGSAKAGRRAGMFDRYGYMKVRLGGMDFRSHRVVWLLEHGEWPSLDIDHIDGNKSNNRPENLRLCNDSQNIANTRPKKWLKFKGVTRHKCGRYQATCQHRYLGLFATEEAAARAYDAAALHAYGEFARLNFPAKKMESNHE